MFEAPYLKEAKAILHAALRAEHYRKDISDPSDLENLRTCREALRKAVRSKSKKEIESAEESLLAVLRKVQPPRDHPAIRENTEFLLVVVVVILVGMRTYVFGNFEIPTASMQPTLNGVIAHRTESEPPNLLDRAREFVVFGRTYANVVCERENDTIVSVRPSRVMLIWNGATITMASGLKYEVGIDPRVLNGQLGVGAGLSYEKGEPIVRGYADAGDHLIADKVSWNFVAPKRGQVIIFKTNGIDGIARGTDGEDVFYIKRLAALPGDTLRIAQPKLFINGHEADGTGFKNVESEQNGYGGYWNELGAKYLRTPDETFIVPVRGYFALGDNSANSLDSRYWGPVPAKNVEGRAAFVYWPFKHFGFIH
jgi:signal peptidase I